MTGMEHAIDREKVIDVLVMSPMTDAMGTSMVPIRRTADEILALVAPALQAARAEAWAECSQWHAEQGMPVNGAGDEHNPYRAEGDGRAVGHE